MLDVVFEDRICSGSAGPESSHSRGKGLSFPWWRAEELRTRGNQVVATRSLREGKKEECSTSSSTIASAQQVRNPTRYTSRVQNPSLTS
jgi:hypothetical protein